MGRPAVWTELVCAACSRVVKIKPHKARKGQRFCSVACRNTVHVPPRMIGNQHAFKGDAAGPMAMRMRAQRMFPLGPECERCGGPPEVRHHRDEDPAHNVAENIETLCRTCHAKHHHVQAV